MLAAGDARDLRSHSPFQTGEIVDWMIVAVLDLFQFGVWLGLDLAACPTMPNHSVTVALSVLTRSV